MTGTKKERLANFELLRCISMMLVIVLHFLGKGGILPSLEEKGWGGTDYFAWALECLSIVAVNVYMLLSGYFLVESEFSVSRLFRLWAQVFFYSFGIGVIAYAMGYVPEGGWNIYYGLRFLLPISKNHYWFMTAYLFMYLFAPFLAAGVKKLSRKQFRTFLFLLLFAFSIVKSISPVPLETDMQGYDVIWYLCVFLLAAYIRIYGFSFFEKKYAGPVVYAAASVGIFGLSMLYRAVYLKTGKLSDVLTVCLHYNHVLVLLAAVGFFYIFYHMRIRNKMISKIVCAVSPLTLGVYLLHCHTVTDKNWQLPILKLCGNANRIGGLLLGTVLAVVCVFTVGIAVDAIRKLLFDFVAKVIGQMGNQEKDEG